MKKTRACSLVGEWAEWIRAPPLTLKGGGGSRAVG